MQIYLLGPRGGLHKVQKAKFNDEEGYIIDDHKILYLWLGSKLTEKKKEIYRKKINILNEKRKNIANIQILYQGKEYGSFVAIKDFLKKGIGNEEDLERRNELEIQYEDTVELIDLGLPPDLEAEITLLAHKFAQEKDSYEDLCQKLAKKQLMLIKDNEKITQNDIDKKAEEIFKSSTTYEELCWLLAELSIITEDKYK
ncbi:MAG: hypothetical protein GF353_16840 [Candidatus Lokiarchaeota archaeon]|nr:hypothetical protein [Candidatus Lokiarchaeota archaeon]